MKNILFFFLFSLLLIGTIQSQTEGATDKLFNRTWNKTVAMPPATYSFTFKSDSSCTFINPANQMSITAKFKL